MCRPDALTLAWTPQSAPQRVTPARPAAPGPTDRPAPARRVKHLPAAPLPMPALPARTLPAPEAPAPAVPAPDVPVPTSPATATGRQAIGIGRPGGLTAVVAVGHGIALQRQETLQALLDVDAADLGALVAEGTVLEVPLGAGRRYVLTDAVPAAVLTAALAGAAPAEAVAA